MTLLGFDEFQWRAMTSTINEIKPAASLIKDLVFKQENTVPSEYIDVDVVIGGRKVAPFVSPIQGGIVVEKMTREMRTVRAPRIRIKKPFTAQDLLTTRAPGVGFYGGSGDISSYRRLRLGQELDDLKNNRIANTIEWMAAQALTGSIAYASDNLDFLVDFQMPAAHKVTLTGTDLWSDTTNSDPMKNIDDWAELIINAIGVGPDVMIVGTTAAQKLRKNADVRALLDNRRTEAGGLTWRATSNYLGNLNGIDLYRYGSKYTSLAGTETNFFNANYVALIATRARFSIEYALILDFKAQAEVMAKYFAKSWEEEDPSVAWVLAESRPLPVPWQPEAIVYAKVV